ncbi:hypothetical protein R1sor_007561 [Riccia sorocarpa]|uniref:AAA+ ATPase domain-containing protein n=1 Tax=Riccia sorocarpa TaxID=122646 RepID=A0ABD3HUG3_9MARC
MSLTDLLMLKLTRYRHFVTVATSRELSGYSHDRNGALPVLEALILTFLPVAQESALLKFWSCFFHSPFCKDFSVPVSEKGRVLKSEGRGSRSASLLETGKSGIAVNCGTAWPLILLELWISSKGRILEKGKLVSHFMNHIGRVLAMAVVFIVLGLSPTKLLHRRALAAPSVASTAPRDVMNTGISGVEEETDNYVKQMETKVLEAEAIEQKLADLEILEKETAEGIRSEREFTRKIKEAIGRKGKGREAGAIRQAEEYLRRLQREIATLEKEVAINIDNYLSIWKEVDAIDVGSAQRESKEETLKAAEDRLVISWRKIAVLEAAVERIYDLWWEILTVKQGDGEQAKYAKELERIAADVESQRTAEKEAKILPLATKVTTGEQPFDSLIDEEDRETLAKIKEEQRKTKKLDALLNKLLENLYSPVDEEDPEFQKLLAEAKAILPPEMRATFGRGGDINTPVDDLEMALEWKSWRGEVDEDFKTFLSQNPEKRQEFIQEVQKEVLVARDRVLTQTWYDEKKRRWEMEPIAALLAVDKKLAGRARIRQDRCVMYLTLKGDDREYYVNTRVFNAEYEDVGGFDMMYFKLLLSGAPTTIETMWIPFEEWGFERLFFLPFKMVYWLLEDVWNSSLVTSIRPWYFKTLSGAFEEFMIRFGFPLVQNLLPHRLRVSLGFDLPEGAEAAEPTDIMIWQQEAQKHVEARYGEGSGSPAWWISLPVRAYIVGMPLLFVVKLALRVLLYPFKPLELEMNEAEWKEKMQEKMEKELEPQMKKQTMDPIKNVFDKMKRVKRPEVLLKDFAGIDVIKEEINEVIRFLKDPKLFKEMGARPPRGVLIVGDSGTGKTTLALAIAAEARVPMIELQGAELEGGAWVGQGASNVRELFKTARELAPLIIFMDDFDHFAGVRGATSDTRKQDHESLINQLLVELDGFETQEGVVLVATTSRPYAIDEALRRPGRMDRTIELPLPNKREREQMLRQIALSSMDPHLVEYVDWGRVAEKTAGLTPAHLKHVPQGLEANAVSNKIVDDEELFSIFGWLTLVSKIAPRWFIDSKWYKKYNDNLLDWLGLRVTKEDILNAVESLDVYGETRPGIELHDPPYVWTREFKYPHAVWAVGKGLVTLLLPNYDVLDLIWLDPRSWEGIAFTKTSQRLEGGFEETGTMTRSYYEKELVSCFGSFVASRMLLPFGQNNTLSKFEMENAKEIATRMVMEYGWAPDDSPMIYQTDGSPTALSMGDQHEGEVAEKINRLYFTACEKAAEMLERNRPVMEAMVEHLLTCDAIGKQDFARIMEEKGAVLEQEPFSLVPYTHIEIVGAPTNGSGRSSKSLSVPSYT